jgi:hypothetical protein
MTADIGKHFLLKAIALHPKIREHINYKGTTHAHETYNSTEQRFSPTVGGKGCEHAEEPDDRHRDTEGAGDRGPIIDAILGWVERDQRIPCNKQYDTATQVHQYLRA